MAGSDWHQSWEFPEGTTYLNHGSFGPAPIPVREARSGWLRLLDRQPMEFFLRTLQPALLDVRQRLADFVQTDAENLALVDNSTYAMNVVASSVPLQPGDEVVLTDHEYGAVSRLWQRTCQRAGANEPRTAVLPLPIESAEQVVESVFQSVTSSTRLIVVSHITSPTAVILPVAEICRQASQLGIAVCIDGPHAVAQLPLEMDALDCDYYTASCHKWLSAPFGSGFLYVHPRRQQHVTPPVLSWGRWPEPADAWHDEFRWLGTRDPTPQLSIPAAIEFLQQVGLAEFREQTHRLARYAREQLADLCDGEPLVPDAAAWYASMTHMPLPDGDAPSLQRRLWETHGIEVPIIHWSGRRWIRVSCHLYTQQSHIDLLARALHQELRSE